MKYLVRILIIIILATVIYIVAQGDRENPNNQIFEAELETAASTPLDDSLGSDAESAVEMNSEENIYVDGNDQNKNLQENMGEVLTFNVAAMREECVGEAPQECLVINDEYFYDSISGFEYEEGFNYEITVLRKERINPPADASSYTYELVDIISKTAALDEEVSDKEKELKENSWKWVRSVYSNDDTLMPADSSEFILSFNDTNFSSTTDCNNIGGKYTVNENTVMFQAPFVMTLMACPDTTQEEEYINDLKEVQSFFIDEEERLILELKFDTGSMIFEK